MARRASPFDPSPSPQSQPLTKRDVRRNRMASRLATTIDGFASNRQAHYRAQLQALQVDMTLVLRAEPYPGGGADGSGILEDDGDEIRQLVEGMGASLPTDEAAQRDFTALAGSYYRDFVRDVNVAAAERDSELSALRHNYKSSLAELERLTQQKLLQAEEEHKALTNTIRQRLIASLTKKRQQLLRDKEQLDIADGSAFLLHPNHFSINTPGFPPNGVQNRKTRHLRHRQGSPNAGDLDGKKKRKATAMEEEGNESPAPTSFYPPVNDARTARSPLREARDKSAYAQYEAPAYSLERIFTEKELAMATDAAKIATWRYFNQPQEQARQQYDPEANGVANNNSAVDDAMDTGDDDEGMADGVAPTTEGVDQDSPPNEDVAPEMDRSASHQVLTRGGARANPLAALNDLAALATSERAAGIGRTASKDPFAPVIPSHHAVTRTEKSGAPPPGGVTSADMETDFAMIRQSASRLARETADVTSTSANANADADADEEETATNMRRQLLEQALGETGVRQPYRLPLLETGPAVVGRGIDRPPLTGFAPMMNVEHKARPQPTVPAQGMAGSMAAALRGIGLGGGEAMSRTTSVAGGSEAGERPPAAKRGRAKQMV